MNASFFLILLLLPGCGKERSSRLVRNNVEQIVLDVRAMPEKAPRNTQAKLAWGLWKLDKNSIEFALAEGANPYSLSESIKGLPTIPQSAILSPYAIALEGYLSVIYMEEKVEVIRRDLDQLFGCLELLIKNNVSVDRGVTALQANPSMRAFVQNSLARLYDEKNDKGSLDDEESYALFTLERIRTLINEYQPEK